MIRAVAVYCSSSTQVDTGYIRAAGELGQALVESGWSLVYGGNNVGCMGALADAARSAGGRVLGITPRLFVAKGVVDQSCHELVVTECMRERKRLMEERADAFIALPGGLGTLEELFEIIVGRQLGVHDKPIVILNLNGYYDPLLALLEHGIESGFIRPGSRRLWFVASKIPDAIAHLQGNLPLSGDIPANRRTVALNAE